MRMWIMFLGVAVSVALLLSVSGPGVCEEKSADQAYVDAVLDGLVKSGVLTAQQAQQIKADAQQAAEAARAGAKPAKPKWYDTMKFGGYTQARFQWYPDADEKDNEFMVRRSRIKLGAQPTERTEVEIQADFGEGEVSIKDAWVQYELDEAGEWRVRAGQQKIPFGFEGPQSSSVRGPLERNWVARRMILGERDTGVVVYWTDADDAELFEQAKKTDLGAGDYGNVAVGVYNGQGSNEDEVNDSKHISIRLAKPFLIDGDRYLEAGVSYFTGTFFSATASAEFEDNLLGVHVYLPPRPVGFQAEYFNGETEGDDVDGFYAMGLWRPNDDGVAFVRYDEYNGPRKGKGLGNVYDRERWSLGYAHAINDKLELTVEYDIDELATGENEDLFGVQLQLGY